METGGLNLYSFPRQERLRLKRDFDRVFREGLSLQSDLFTVIYLKNDLDFNRIAIIVRKKLGKAHDRNRIKRWIRESYRQMKPELPRGYDIVVIPRKTLSEILNRIDYYVIRNELGKLLKRIGT
ncbi:ribonuclease P protein component [Thermotoga sp. Ku-13t]|uniref:ribonuclease P protein component n=1 Tax=Thermotoga sp. Ku-13t TaxID=1755813 RepID=UPI0013EBAEEC|nr:ribonuclease P protein component [Thermotoga sp. Ku-13t]KAF2958218.1 ribonuclease P protein component [Thermotoga sp. Ku-13t]